MTFTEDQLKDGGKSEGVKMEEEAAKTGGATGTAPGSASSIPIMTEGYEQYLRNLERLEEQKRDRLAEDKERLKRQQLFATIGDGLSAFHEAYNNTRGIKPITSGKSMTGKWQERYDKLMSDIDKSDLASAKNRLETMKARQSAYIAAAKNDYNQKVADARARYYEDTGAANQQRATSYSEGINNQNENRNRDTTSKIEHRQNQDENNTRRTDAFVGKTNAQVAKAMDGGSGGRGSSSGGRGSGSKGSGRVKDNEWVAETMADDPGGYQEAYERAKKIKHGKPTAAEVRGAYNGKKRQTGGGGSSSTGGGKPLPGKKPNGGGGGKKQLPGKK
jgi:hypothetical protein